MSSLLESTPRPPVYYRFAVIAGFIAFINFLLFQPWGTGAVVILLGGCWMALTLFFGFYSGTTSKRFTSPGFLYPSGLFFISLWFITHTATPVLQVFFSLVAAAMLGILGFFLASGERFIQRLGHLFQIPFKWLEGYLTGLDTTLKLSTSQSLQHHYFPNNPRLTRQLVPILSGMLIAIPILAILIGLLSSADPIYGHFVKEWLGFLTDGNLLARIIISIVLVLGLTPLVFALIPGFKDKDLGWLRFAVFPTQYSVVMTLVALTFASFLVVQAPYVFVSVGKETDLHLYGVNTYSEYVQKGFGELVMVALLLFGLVWVGLFSVRAKTNSARFLKAIQLITLIEFLIFLFSIFRRVALYIAYHGWSLNRWYGTILLLWLAGLGINLIGRHLVSKRWLYGDLGITVIFLLVIGFFKPEPFITTHQPPTVNKRVDYLYLSRMSADGYDGWQKAYAHVLAGLNNPTWQQKLLLEKEDRREIAYAGMILAELWVHRLDLLHQYGTDQEIAQAYIQILDTEIARLNQASSQLPFDSKLTQEQRDHELQYTQRLLGNATQLRDGLKNGSKNRADIHSQLKFSKYSHTSFDALNNPISFFMIIPTEQYHNQMIPYPLSAWDRLLLWNGVTSQVARDIALKMPIEHLIQLSTRYFEHSQRILTQPANEREIEWDSQPYSIFLSAGSGN